MIRDVSVIVLTTNKDTSLINLSFEFKIMKSNYLAVCSRRKPGSITNSDKPFPYVALASSILFCVEIHYKRQAHTIYSYFISKVVGYDEKKLSHDFQERLLALKILPVMKR